MSNLEKKWWFIAAVSIATPILTFPLLDSAGVWPIDGFAQGLVSLICLLAINRLLSMAGRVFTIFAFPSSKLLD